MSDVAVAVLGLYLAISAWAKWGGSHIPYERWAQYPFLITNGVRAAAYILWPHSPYQHEDLRRLRQDAGQLGLGFEVLLLRLGWERGTPLPEPAEFLAIFRAKLLYAKRLGYTRLLVLIANEPNLELADLMTPAQFGPWYKALVELWRKDPDLKEIPLVSPTCAGYAANSWAWWDGALRECCALSDYAGLAIYPTSEAEMGLHKKPTDPDVPAWSLPWWLGQIGEKQAVIVEMGCRTGTAAAVRSALLPKLYAQVKASAGVAYAFAFAQWTDGEEHAEHWLSPLHLRALVDANLGVAPVAPPSVPTQPPPLPGGPWPEGVYEVTVRRVR